MAEDNGQGKGNVRIHRDKRRKPEEKMSKKRKQISGETLARKLKLELKTLAEQEKRRYLFLASRSYDTKLIERYKNQAEAVDFLTNEFRNLINNVLRD
jgi:exonuclease VII large subunit